MSAVDTIIHTPFGDALVEAARHADELKAALHLIRIYICQPDKAEDISEVGVRAREVVSTIRAEVDLIGKQMLTDFEVGPVACIVSESAQMSVHDGCISLSFGVHNPSPGEKALGVTVTPLYK